MPLLEGKFSFFHKCMHNIIIAMKMFRNEERENRSNSAEFCILLISMSRF